MKKLRPQEDSNLSICERRKCAPLPAQKTIFRTQLGRKPPREARTESSWPKFSPVPQPGVAGHEYYQGPPHSIGNGHL